MNWLIPLLKHFPSGKAFLNKRLIERFASSTEPRPHRFSLWGPTPPSTPAPAQNPPTTSAFAPTPSPSSPSCYTSWPSLVDRTFTARHLPPRDDGRSVPECDPVIKLLMRRGDMIPSERTSVLFCFFAQWFTDSFLRTHPQDPRRNTSNHEIDLCQIYGLDEPTTWALREGSGGLLKSRLVDDEEYPVLLYKNGAIDPRFFHPHEEIGLSFLRAGRAEHWVAELNKQSNALTDPDRRDFFYAAGLDRAGSTVVYSAFNTIFLREHNRIARAISDHHRGQPAWDDNRIFETARMVNIRQILTVVVNDYIRHIGGGVFPFELDRTFAEKRPWYRTNRISIEFNLLYRWHSLIPDVFMLDGHPVNQRDYRFNNKLLEDNGVEKIITAASTQKAGRFGLFNAPGFMEKAERGGLKWARTFGVQPFNRYRERFDLPSYDSIDALAGDAEVAAALKSVYGDNVDDVELTIGLLAEGRGEGELMPETVVCMVANDAFTHILTNPLLSTEVHCPETFSEVGWEIVEQKATLEDIVKRNVKHPEAVTVSLSA